MKIIKNLIIVFVISIVFVATGTKAASIYYTQETLAQYSELSLSNCYIECLERLKRLHIVILAF